MLRSDCKPSDCSIVRTTTIADLECLTKNINDHRHLQTHPWQDTILCSKLHSYYRSMFRTSYKIPLSSENHCKIDTFSCHYFFPGMVWSTAISISACLSVCSHIVKTTCLIISLIVCTCYTWLWPDLILMTWRILWMMLCFHTMVHIKWLGGSGHRQVTHPSVTHCHNDTDSPTTGSK